MSPPPPPEHVQASWDILRVRIPDAIVVEFAKLLLAFEANEANGNGALRFDANHGQPQDWAVKSEVTVRRPLTHQSKKA